MRSKGVRNKKQLMTATARGQVVSVDNLVSPISGFIPTHRGRSTTNRYVSATLFVHHFYDFIYIHLMDKLGGESTVEAKHTFECV